MGSLFGRDAELARGRAVLDSAARGRIVRAIRIVGSSGVGKTALAEALAHEAAAQGWLVVWAPSFRIHSALSLFDARRIVQALIEALGENAARYSSGLTVDRDRPDDFAEAFLRIIEGVTLDHRLLLVLDDAHWADPESCALIERTVTALADRAIVVLSAERSDEGRGSALALADQAIALDDLTLQAAVEVVRAIYPGVNDDVATGIASETRGRPADVVAVATAARDNRATTLRDVSANTRRVVARDLSLLEPNIREFLQMCAVIDEPIDLRLLQQLWPSESLFAMIAEVSNRYLVANENGLHFVHATIMESILETIPIQMPLRRRVIDALKRLPSPRLEDYERLANQCAACGDHAGERAALIRLSDEATAKSMLSLSASTLERALAIASPMTEEIVPTYERLAQLYNGMGREVDAIRVCRRGLNEAEAAGITAGIGALVASIAIAQCHSGFIAEARATIARYEDVVSDAERASLFSIGELIAMHTLDVESADRFRARFERYAGNAASVVAIRHHSTNALLAIRLGDEQRALERIKQAETAAEGAPLFGMMPLGARMCCMLGFRGVTPTEQFIASLGHESRPPLAFAVQANLMIARGEFADVEELLADKLSISSESSIRRVFMGARYTAAALRELGPSEPAWQVAHQEVAAFEAGERAPTLLPIVIAALTPLSTQAPARAKRLLDKIIDAARQPSDMFVFLYPELLVLAARALEAHEALDVIASGELWSDQQPWNRAHHALARGMAGVARHHDDHREFISDACDRFTRLGATYFAELASKFTGVTRPVAGEGRLRPNNTTRRELEIAGLVANGLTNREIAEQLVLSERTVEGHIANLFAKVNVNSRTQLATWFMRTISSVA